MEKRGSVRIARKKALSMDELLRMYIESMRLAPALNTRRIFAAWDEASGAAHHVEHDGMSQCALQVVGIAVLLEDGALHGG